MKQSEYRILSESLKLFFLPTVLHEEHISNLPFIESIHLVFTETAFLLVSLLL